MSRLALAAASCIALLVACAAPTSHLEDDVGSDPLDSGVAAVDAGADDGGTDLGPEQDAGAADAGEPDAGPADSGLSDAGADDAGPQCLLDAGREDAGGYVPVTVINDTGSTAGIFDPSLWYEADGGGGFMTYSSVPAQNQLQTRIAYSNDRGATWTWFGNVNQPAAVMINTTDNNVCGAPTCSGNWVHETSSLVYDEADPDATRRFKVFVHSYFATPSAIHYTIGTVTMFTTAFPGPSAVWAETKILGWNSSSPSSSTNVTHNITTDPNLAASLGGCLLLTEPGALVRSTALDVAFGCPRFVANKGVVIDTVLLRSVNHGASWSFVSTLLSHEDAALFGGGSGTNAPAFNGANLFQRDGRTWLFATPNGPIQGTGDGYRGCITFEVTDVDAGTVARCGGAPIPAKKFLGPQAYFTGPCTWAPGATSANTLVPIANLPFGTFFQIFSMPYEDPY